MKNLSVLVLAAGQGTRMKSVLPKVLHPVCGRPLLEHVLNAAQALQPEHMAVVLGFARDQVKQALGERGWSDLEIVVQPQPRGSGHAVLMAKSWLKKRRGTLLIVYGDTPLLTPATLKAFVDAHKRSKKAGTFLTMDVANPAGYGRMVLDGSGDIVRIVEHKDATAQERAITCVNSGVVCWEIAALLKALPKLKPNNAKHEYYLTDVAAILRAQGKPVGVFNASNPQETLGVNHRGELAEAEGVLRQRILKHWMESGVTMIDPATTYIDSEAQLASDVTLGPSVVIRGKTRIESFCEIAAFTVIEEAVVKSGAKVGPFARLRPGTVVAEKARVGNFVEIKKTRLGRGSKVNHLSYIGDAEVGDGVNIGAGTITCNYDGFKKAKTHIDAGVFVGSNTNLVAPVRVHAGAIIGAGSTITKDVPANALAVARAKQLVKEKWAYEFRKKQKSA